MLYCSFSAESPNFQSKVENVTILSSSSSNLLCQAKRGPAPVITWYKSRDGITHQILQNSTSVIYNYEVYSRRLDEVKCVARNSFGSDDKRLLVNTQGISKGMPFMLCFYYLYRICMCKKVRIQAIWSLLTLKESHIFPSSCPLPGNASITSLKYSANIWLCQGIFLSVPLSPWCGVIYAVMFSTSMNFSFRLLKDMQLLCAEVGSFLDPSWLHTNVVPRCIYGPTRHTWCSQILVSCID